MHYSNLREGVGSAFLSVQLFFQFFRSLTRQFSSRNMTSRKYIEQLLEQGQVNICPECFKTGKREEFCTNAVVLLPEKVLVCCYLGDKHEITAEEFEKKVAALKKKA